jgi:hypothetical protein
VANHGELNLTKEAEERITRGLRSALQGLDGAGKGEGAAPRGSLSNMSLSAKEASGDGLARTFADFCQFWQLGVNTLERTANLLGSQLSQAAGVLWEEDRRRAGALRAGLGTAGPGTAAAGAGVGVSGILGSFGGLPASGAPDYGTQPYPQNGPGVNSGDDVKTVNSSIWDFVGAGGSGADRGAGNGSAGGGDS